MKVSKSGNNFSTNLIGLSVASVKQKRGCLCLETTSLYCKILRYNPGISAYFLKSLTSLG